jgi:chemotaxis protein MotB
VAKQVMKKAVEDTPSSAGTPLWVITFSDTMGLLLCFFITLFSLSTIKKEKFVNYATALRGYLNKASALPSNDMRNVEGPETSLRDFLGRVGMTSRAREEEQLRGLSGFTGDKIRVRSIREGLQITLGAKQLFDEGSARLRIDDPTVRESLEYLAKELVGYRFVIKLNGFASPTEFGRIKDRSIRDLWELSFARARSVMDYLAHGTKPDFQITEKRFRIGACGPANLVKDPSGAEIPAENRSVEIIVTEQRVFFEGEDEPLQ